MIAFLTNQTISYETIFLTCVHCNEPHFFLDRKQPRKLFDSCLVLFLLGKQKRFANNCQR